MQVTSSEAEQVAVTSSPRDLRRNVSGPLQINMTVDLERIVARKRAACVVRDQKIENNQLSVS